MDGSYCVKPLKQKQVVNTPPLFLANLILKDVLCNTVPLFYLSPGGWSELSTAGDLWDREQIQQPGIKGRHQTGELPQT